MTVTDTTSTTTSHNADFTGSMDYEALYLAQKEQNEALQGVLLATRSQAVTANPLNTKPSVTSDRVRAIHGDGFHKLSRAQKLQSLGVDPVSISDDGLKALFGRGNDGKLAQDLAKTNMGRYRLLKECALILNIYAG
jgi:hypothetical protein